MKNKKILREYVREVLKEIEGFSLGGNVSRGGSSFTRMGSTHGFDRAFLPSDKGGKGGLWQKTIPNILSPFVPTSTLQLLLDPFGKAGQYKTGDNKPSSDDIEERQRKLKELEEKMQEFTSSLQRWFFHDNNTNKHHVSRIMPNMASLNASALDSERISAARADFQNMLTGFEEIENIKEPFDIIDAVSDEYDLDRSVGYGDVISSLRDYLSGVSGDTRKEVEKTISQSMLKPYTYLYLKKIFSSIPVEWSSQNRWSEGLQREIEKAQDRLELLSQRYTV